jgi:hypothetical protein
MKSKLELLNLVKSYVEVNYNPNANDFEILCDEELLMFKEVSLTYVINKRN